MFYHHAVSFNPFIPLTQSHPILKILNSPSFHYLKLKSFAPSHTIIISSTLQSYTLSHLFRQTTFLPHQRLALSAPQWAFKQVGIFADNASFTRLLYMTCKNEHNMCFGQNTELICLYGSSAIPYCQNDTGQRVGYDCDLVLLVTDVFDELHHTQCL